jgi:hypothetical protein
MHTKKIKTKKPKKPIGQAKVKKVKKPKGQAMVIINQKLPQTKCCTDPLKSGQAYTIPLGYTDRLGTMRIVETPNASEGKALPIPINRIPVVVPRLRPSPIQLPINEVITINAENPVVEERILTLLPPPQEILRQIQQKNKPAIEFIIEDNGESENTVIRAPTQPPVAQPKRTRRTKQQLDEAKMMGEEDKKKFVKPKKPN